MALLSLTCLADTLLPSLGECRPRDGRDDTGGADKEVAVESFIENEPAEVTSDERLEKEE